MKRFMAQVTAFLACTRGVSAIEFALFAPILCLGLLATVDIGMLAATRMELDRNVRAGAQAAITLDNPGSSIRAIVQAAADDPELPVTVEMTCRCDSTPTDCALLCPSGEEPSVFYTIEAERLYSGALLEERTVASAARVQVR